ncbi:hypothetical protein V1226_06400 [Lachnospiraceae bacterium JLR.KK009]|nr:hypothetical protein C810_00870 [Lachnospiraceae bacterium A2]
MNLSVTIYPGDYQIKQLGKTDYLHCGSPRKRKIFFDGKGHTKDFFSQIVSLDIDDLNAIKEFTKQYGILVNTQNDPEHPTFMGLITNAGFNEKYLSFSSGCSMPLSVFKNYITLIKNMLLLATAISLDYKSQKEYAENSAHIIEYFLTVLLQPYGYNDIIHSKIDWTIGGNTPLTRLAFYGGRFCSKMHPLFRASQCMHLFIHTLQDFNRKNRALLEKFNSEKTPNGSFYDIPIFQAEKSVSYGKDSLPNGCKFSVSDTEIIDFLSSDYAELCEIFNSLTSNFHFSLDNDYKINVELNSTDGIKLLMTQIIKISQKLLIETINFYANGINFEVSASDKKKKYDMRLVPQCFLQGIFLAMGCLLNKYQVTVCKYKKCNKPVISLISRPALCCCHNHLTNYRSQIKRDSLKGGK